MTHFITPSTEWIRDTERKQAMINDYKTKLKCVICAREFGSLTYSSLVEASTVNISTLAKDLVPSAQVAFIRTSTETERWKRFDFGNS